jgi:hypothetical protein
MNSSLRLPIGALILIGAASPASGLTIAEALGTPSRVWTATEGVTVDETPGLSHDGAGVVRIEPGDAVLRSISTAISEPSVVTFWLRAGGLERPTRAVAGQSTIVVTEWVMVRQVVLPGEYRILHDAFTASPTTPLYVDELAVTPLATVPLGEAAEAPGAVPASSPGVIGLVDPLTAPDGEDAIYFTADASAIVPITVAGPACLTCRYAPISPSLERAPVRSGSNVQWVSNGRLFASIPSGATFAEVGLSSAVAGDGQTRIDQIQVLPPVSPAEALEAPALVFDLVPSGDLLPVLPAAFPSAPDGAEGQDAVLMDASQGGSGFVRTTVSGRGTLSFRVLGALVLEVGGDAYRMNDPGQGQWWTATIALPEGAHSLRWSAMENARGWLDAVRFDPGPSAFAASLLGAPDASVSFNTPASLQPTQDSPTSPAKLWLSWLPWEATDAVMEIGVTGPCVFSLAASQAATVGSNRNVALGAGPECGWPGRLSNGAPQTAFLIPLAGPQTVRIRRYGTFDELGVLPLEEVALAEAADAPGLVFRTSAATPWRGVRTPAMMDFDGQDALCGGEHASAANPWIETDVTGPGLLRFRLELSAQTLGAGDERDTITLDGVSVPTPEATGPRRQRVLSIPTGVHTVRWTQHGSRALTATGSVLWLDEVSFEASTPVSIGEALETGDRSWITGTTGPVLPLATSAAPDGSDAVYFPSEAGFIETTVRLPCQLEVSGTGIFLESGLGLSFTPTPTSSVWFLDGTSTTTLRIRRSTEAPLSVVSRVQIFEPSVSGSIEEVMGVPGVPWQTGGFSTWSYLRNQATGAVRLLIKGLTSTSSIFLEATIPGPFRLQPVVFPASSAPTITLPDNGGNALTPPAWVGGSADRRVRLRFGRPSQQLPSTLIIASAGWQPGLPPGAASGGPEWTWTTGGDLPWQDSATSPVGLVGGPVAAGQVSWLEGRLSVPTPSVVRWKLGAAHAPNLLPVVTDVSVNDIPLPLATSTWLHVPAGTHRIRWHVQGAPNGTDPIRSALLSDLRVTAKPTGSVQEILGAPDLLFVQRGTHARTITGGVLEWPEGSPWFPVTDPVTGRRALQTAGGASADTNPLWVLRPGPGTINALLRGDQLGVISEPNPRFPVASLPFPWTPLGTQPTHTGAHPWFLKLDGGLAHFWVDDVSFTPATTVAIGEALDIAGLNWQSGGSRPRLIGGWAGATPGSDAVICQGLRPGESAWIETAVTGPAVLTWQRTDALRMEVSVNGQRAQRFTGRPGAPTNVPLVDTLSLGNGLSTVRWEFSRELAGGDAAASLDSLSVAAASPSADIPALVDQPGLSWTLTPALSRAASTTTHDGVDALEIVPLAVEPPNLQPEYTLATEIVGPGVFRCWFRGALAYLRAKSDDTIILASAPASGAWKEFITPVPAGTYRFSLVGTTSAWLDEVSWTPLPSLSLAAALDAPDGTEITPVPGAVIGAAAWGAFAADTEDSVILLPGLSHRLSVPAPAGSTLSLRARSLGGETTLAVGVAEQRASLRPTSWTTVEFPVASFPDTEGVVIRASSSGGPVLLDQLVVRPPSSTPYQTWLAVTGLAGHPLPAPDQDADGDTLPNVLEFAFGLNPLQSSGTDAPSQLPTVRLLPRPGLPPTVIVEFSAVPGVRYEIEVAAPETPGVWTQAAALSTATAGRRSWAVPESIPATAQLLVRVRVSLL